MLYETTLRHDCPEALRHVDDRVGEEAEDYISVDLPDPLDVDARYQQGRSLRLAMALIQGADAAAADRQARAQELRSIMNKASGTSPAPDDPAEVIERLRRLARVGDRGLAEQLRLLRRFDDLKLWEADGCRDCAMWLDRHLGISRNTALERLRAAKVLEDLPTVDAMFTVGRLAWSQVREITRVADAESEQELADTVLNLSITETIAVCRRWRWRNSCDEGDDGDADGAESAAAQRAYDNRSLDARMKDPATMRITLDLPIELGAEFMKSLECQDDRLRELEREASAASDASGNDLMDNNVCDEAESPAPIARRTASVRRADAALELSRRALAHEGEAVAMADRYRVIATLDARVLADDVETGFGTELPPERPGLIGWGPIAVATARRLAEMSSLSVIAQDDTGEVVGTGRSTRLCSTPVMRALIARDRCCRMPGCSNTRWGHAHHVKSWAEGGRTGPDNLLFLCSGCHIRVHEGGFTLERVLPDDVELGDSYANSTLDGAAAARATARIAKVASFRVLDRHGHVVAGPARAVRPVDPHLRGNEEGGIARGGKIRLEDCWVGGSG